MRNIVVIIMSLTILSNGILYAQHNEADKYGIYKGGIDSLKKDITKESVNVIERISMDYILFFQVSLNKKGFTSIKELYRKQDSVSYKVQQSIEKTSVKWSGAVKGNDKVVIPIFLVKDRESLSMNDASFYTITSGDYEINNKPIKCILIPPVVINYFHQE